MYIYVYQALYLTNAYISLAKENSGLMLDVCRIFFKELHSKRSVTVCQEHVPSVLTLGFD